MQCWGQLGVPGDRHGAGMGGNWQNKDPCPAQSSHHMLAPTPRAVPSLLTAAAFSLLPTGTWVCQTGQIKSTTDLP